MMMAKYCSILTGGRELDRIYSLMRRKVRIKLEESDLWAVAEVQALAQASVASSASAYSESLTEILRHLEMGPAKQR
jgi:hypothetical protein